MSLTKLQNNFLYYSMFEKSFKKGIYVISLFISQENCLPLVLVLVLVANFMCDSWSEDPVLFLGCTNSKREGGKQSTTSRILLGSTSGKDTKTQWQRRMEHQQDPSTNGTTQQGWEDECTVHK